jgi:hypothetical protein
MGRVLDGVLSLCHISAEVDSVAQSAWQQTNTEFGSAVLRKIVKIFKKERLRDVDGTGVQRKNLLKPA